MVIGTGGGAGNEKIDYTFFSWLAGLIMHFYWASCPTVFRVCFVRSASSFLPSRGVSRRLEEHHFVPFVLLRRKQQLWNPRQNLTVSPRPSHPGHSLIDTHGDRYFELTHNFTAPAAHRIAHYQVIAWHYIIIWTCRPSVVKYGSTVLQPPPHPNSKNVNLVDFHTKGSRLKFNRQRESMILYDTWWYSWWCYLRTTGGTKSWYHYPPIFPPLSYFDVITILNPLGAWVSIWCQ